MNWTKAWLKIRPDSSWQSQLNGGSYHLAYFEDRFGDDHTLSVRGWDIKLIKLSPTLCVEYSLGWVRYRKNFEWFYYPVSLEGIYNVYVPKQEGDEYDSDRESE